MQTLLRSSNEGAKNSQQNVGKEGQAIRKKESSKERNELAPPSAVIRKTTCRGGVGGNGKLNDIKLVLPERTDLRRVNTCAILAYE